MRQTTVINFYFSDALNLSHEQGSKLFADYTVKNFELRGNEMLKAIIGNKELFSVDIKARTYRMFGRTMNIFCY